MKILIVEDSKLVSERLRLAFADLPRVETVVTDRIDTGLRHFRLFRPEMLILDIEVADGSGMSLLGKVKLEAPATIVAIFTNHPGFRRRCAAAGADFFFDKSSDFEPLASTVRHLAEARQ